MTDSNSRYQLKAEILTPLSIGQGTERDWVQGIDYVLQDGDLYHLDMAQMPSVGIDMALLADYFASGQNRQVEELIGDHLQDVSDFQMAMPCPTTAPIKTFLRNNLTDRPVLAGSSLKGAIRSALFARWLDRHDAISSQTGYWRTSTELNRLTFGTPKDGSDFMRCIQVGDMEFDVTRLINTKVFNLHSEDGCWHAGWKHGRTGTRFDYAPEGFNTVYECLCPGDSAEGSFVLAKALFEKVLENPYLRIPYREKKQKLMLAEHPHEVLCEIIRQHTLTYLEREAAFFECYNQAEHTADILHGIAVLQTKVKACAPNECILKMSAGSGFHSITGDWQFDDYVSGELDRKRNRGAKPKSRKIAIYETATSGLCFSLMGFVKLSFKE